MRAKDGFVAQEPTFDERRAWLDNVASRLAAGLPVRQAGAEEWDWEAVKAALNATFSGRAVRDDAFDHWFRHAWGEHGPLVGAFVQMMTRDRSWRGPSGHWRRAFFDVVVQRMDPGTMDDDTRQIVRQCFQDQLVPDHPLDHLSRAAVGLARLANTLEQREDVLALVKPWFSQELSWHWRDYERLSWALVLLDLPDAVALFNETLVQPGRIAAPVTDVEAEGWSDAQGVRLGRQLDFRWGGQRWMLRSDQRLFQWVNGHWRIVKDEELEPLKIPQMFRALVAPPVIQEFMSRGRAWEPFLVRRPPWDFLRWGVLPAARPRRAAASRPVGQAGAEEDPIAAVVAAAREGAPPVVVLWKVPDKLQRQAVVLCEQGLAPWLFVVNRTPDDLRPIFEALVARPESAVKVYKTETETDSGLWAFLKVLREGIEVQEGKVARIGVNGSFYTWQYGLSDLPFRNFLEHLLGGRLPRSSRQADPGILRRAARGGRPQFARAGGVALTPRGLTGLG